MKKLAIVLMVVVASCTRTVMVSGPTGGLPKAAGTPTPREALQRFLAAAKNQDLQELGLSWGTTEGPELKAKESTDERNTREQREIILFCFLKHDSYRVLGEAPGQNSERVMAVELTFKGLTRSTNFMVTRGPQDRWYVRQFDIEALRDICARK